MLGGKLKSLLSFFLVVTSLARSYETSVLKARHSLVDVNHKAIGPFGKGCHLDRTQPPVLEALVKCHNSTMFNVWRPKARFIGPRGWMNDPMGIFQTKNGSYHIGYQCNPNHLVWSNISQCSASTKDFIYFNDYGSWKDPVTIAPSQLYDIRGVFDGSVIPTGWEGHPSIIYTSTFTGPLGAMIEPAEKEGVETQSVAYTKDDGATWTKLNFGSEGNPIIYRWPEPHLSGFRDPFVFEWPEFSAFYANTSIFHHLPNGENATKPVGKNYLLLSGGIRNDAQPANGGPRLFLYRQTNKHDIRGWTYLGPLLTSSPQYNQPSPWNGGRGLNYECGALIKITEHGRAHRHMSTSQTTELNVFTVGTEGARNSSHENHWPLWQAANWNFNTTDGKVEAVVEFSGVLDWGRTYAFTTFASGDRQLIVGWTYEDDEENILTPQRGAQGAFTLFREIFVQVIHNVHPKSLDPEEKHTSWKVQVKEDGSHSVITVGQRILPEITTAFRERSSVRKFKPCTINAGSLTDTDLRNNFSTNLISLPTQPKDKFYVIRAQLKFLAKNSIVRGGFRILASKHEWTDVYYDPNEEYLIIDRSKSSAIPTFGKDEEKAKLRLWPILNPDTQEIEYESLDLTIVVDNSVIEVHANERAIITTRVYPWYEESSGVSYMVQGRPTVVEEVHSARLPAIYKKEDNTVVPGRTQFEPESVQFSNVELWDGLLNAWPNRPHDTSLPGTYSHNLTSTFYGLWPDV
ncbi:hypothetical protein O181_004475 [Austropuccinia psidii MF-1]|uniref:Glycoside hydrolase family 32 protein n=1 Tax=Austropuccinia psidii MF-1 TaxID=1389203 RepID=A0A9Q3BH16_9BASI|nr:hypothetical protein [Austropuccinia psidii MF-1]